MRLRSFEFAFVLVAALGCTAMAVGALYEFGSTRAGVGMAALCLLFAYGLVTRAMAAVMLLVLISSVSILVALLLLVDGAVSLGLTTGLTATLFLLVVGRAVLRELDWWSV